MNSRVGKTLRLLDNNIWKEYNKTYPPKKYSFENREDFKVVVKEICKVISERLIESTAGVFISNFGYLFNWKVPNKKGYTLTKSEEGIQKKYNLYGERHMHLPTFIPHSDLEGWCMDGTFNRTLKLNLKSKLNQSKKYKMYPYSFQNLLK